MKKETQMMNTVICGVDEVGRGAAVGDIFAAACILPDLFNIPLRDSKKLSPKKRTELAHVIQTDALDWAIGRVNRAEIDLLNVHRASLLAMERAFNNLQICPDRVIVDGKYPLSLSVPCRNLVGGDDRVPAISAASILAKVLRDEYMNLLHERYPEYCFQKNKGYLTKDHLAALKQFGPCPEHRTHYRPVKEAREYYYQEQKEWFR